VLTPFIVWSLFLMVKGLGIAARARGEVRTLAIPATAYLLEIFATNSLLLGYFLTDVGWISWPEDRTQNPWVLIGMLGVILVMMIPLFLLNWSTPELKQLQGKMQRLAMARAALIFGVVVLGFMAYMLAFGLTCCKPLSQQDNFSKAVANILPVAVLAILVGAWIFTARGLLQMARVLGELKTLNPVQARV